jgi:hypothetical protein
MASIGVKISSTHAKLHRRGNSTSSVGSSPLPPTAEGFPITQADFRTVRYSDEALDERAKSPPPSQNGKPLKIKPYIRKLTSKEANKIDLSRTAAENERLAGLGIHEYSVAARSASDVTFAPVSGRARHNRTTSNNSQFSTKSGTLQRPTAPYAHPMRQTPRPYTPPIAKSYTTSMIGSEGSDEAMDIMSDDEYRHRQRMFDPSHRSDSFGSIPAHPPPLHIHTSGSLTRLNNMSQSSLQGGRSRGDTLRSVDTLTPSSRTSMDKTLTFIRTGKGDESVDPASRAASIRAARIAYNEKEEAKAMRAEKEAMKQRERESRKHAKNDDRIRRKSDADETGTRIRSNSGNEKQEFVGKAYNDFTPAHSRSLPALVATANSGGRTRAYTKSSSRSSRRSVKSSWLGFLAWFRTRLLRLGKKLHMSS